MEKSEIKEILNRIFLQDFQLFPDEIKEEQKLEELEMDSLEVLSLISICEDKFHISLDDFEILTTSTVSNVIDIIYHQKN